MVLYILTLSLWKNILNIVSLALQEEHDLVNSPLFISEVCNCFYFFSKEPDFGWSKGYKKGVYSEHNSNPGHLQLFYFSNRLIYVSVHSHLS